MHVLVGNWSLSKAGEDQKTVSVRMIANRLTLDREKEELLPEAFNKATVERFLKYGIIDWHHQSVSARTPEARAAAILGKPTDFQWEEKLPVVYGRLTKAHPIVSTSIIPHLEAEQPVFAASIGGSVLKARIHVDATTRDQHKQIQAIDWNHIAIAASPYVISPGSEVSMVKATGDVLVTFSDFDNLVEDCMLLGRGDDIKKALQVGAGTASAGLQGADALRQQSLEGGVINLSFITDKVLDALRHDRVEPTREAIIAYLSSEGLPEAEIRVFIDGFMGAASKLFGGKSV